MSTARGNSAAAVNSNKINRWAKDISQSVAMYNDWFMKFAPSAYRDTRVKVAQDVEHALKITDNVSGLTAEILQNNPTILPTLRMAACPPLAVDRLIGLAGVPPSLVGAMEKDGRLPPRLNAEKLKLELEKIVVAVKKLLDPDIFVWINRKEGPTEAEIHRAATIIADRLCGAVANPIVRNTQEKRQLSVIESWLKSRGYVQVEPGVRFDVMPKGTYGFRMNVPVNVGESSVNIPVDAVVMPKEGVAKLPLLIEAKSAGDFTNVNKRRKEEAVKMAQLRTTYGADVRFILFLCGYFDSGYLSYEAAEGIDWVWEHRVDDLAEFQI